MVCGHSLRAILCVILNIFLYGEHSLPIEANPLFVSLGSHCEVASALKRNQLRYKAFPFDWLVSLNTDGLVSLLDRDFADFLNPQYIFPDPLYSHIPEQALYKIEFRHDENLLKQNSEFEREKTKHLRRIERFRQLREFPGQVFFIRIAYDIPLCGDNTYWLKKDEVAISSLNARKLKEALDRYFPELNFTLIILNYVEDFSFPIQEIDNLIEFKIRKSQRNSDFLDILNVLRNAHQNY